MISKDKITGLGSQVPPDYLFVEIYFLQKGKTRLQACEFFKHYCTKGWKNAEGNLIKDWKIYAWQWIWR